MRSEQSEIRNPKSEIGRGNLAVGQSGGPTPVINASLAGVIEEAGRHGEIEGIYGLVHGIEGALGEQLVDLTRASPTVLRGLRHTPGAALGSCRHKLSEEDYTRILEVFRAYDVRYFVYIGGNDSMDTCHRIASLAAGEDYEIRVMGVPKTIDNDLVRTDHCPGYGSAARFVASATMDAGRDLEAMRTFDKVTILETMGRNAGWLTAAAILGKREPRDPPHLVYVPERPLDEGTFLKRVGAIHDELGCVFVVVCEGVQDPSGTFVVEAGSPMRTDAFGHKLVTLTSGVAHYLAGRVREELGLQARHIKPDTIQRSFSACASKTDREEAYRCGAAAVAHAVAGDVGSMVTLIREPGPEYRCSTGLAPLEEVANAQRTLPDDFIGPEGDFVTDAFREYALPLVGDPLPEYVRLDRSRL